MRFRLMNDFKEFYKYVRCDVVLGSRLWFDTETTSLNIKEAQIVGLGFYQEETEEAVFLVVSDSGHLPSTVHSSELIGLLNDLFSKCRMCGHNLLYDLNIMKMNGFNEFKIAEDTIIMAHLFDPDTSKNLENQCTLRLSWEKDSYEKIIGKKWNSVKWHIDTKEVVLKSGEVRPPRITSENLGYYCAEDCLASSMLYNYYKPLLEEWDLQDLYEEIEKPLTEVLSHAKCRGILIDRSKLQQADVELSKEIKMQERFIYEEAGEYFNINSNKQLAEILYDKLELPILSKTKSGAPATDEKTLKKLRKETGHPILSHIAEYNKKIKLHGTYAVGIQKKIDGDGALRGDLNQTGTATLRFSSSNPNLQNLDSEYKLIRDAFVSRPGYKMIMSDYSAQEYAITASASGDEAMLKVFEEGKDIHQWVADMVGVTRKQAKAIGFGILYGLHLDNLASLLGVDNDTAKEYLDAYYAQFPGVRKWKKNIERYTIKKGYIRTVVGSIRRFPNMKTNYYEKGRALRQAVNTCVQGVAAVQIKKAMVDIYREFKSRNLDCHLVLSVHDELGVEARIDQVEIACQIIQRCMEEALPLRAKFKAEPNVVDSYGEGKDDKYNQRNKIKNVNNLNNILHLIV